MGSSGSFEGLQYYAQHHITISRITTSRIYYNSSVDGTVFECFKGTGSSGVPHGMPFKSFAGKSSFPIMKLPAILIAFCALACAHASNTVCGGGKIYGRDVENLREALYYLGRTVEHRFEGVARHIDSYVGDGSSGFCDYYNMMNTKLFHYWKAY
ncbi:hypothetical protein DFQ27_009418 [Actinomortierella ambigua]|uniref:Uncharacterized protein n=1 Tax=Actinomortierella ambigua TaxID=1343610 RepID=A0A9P6PPS6_9FUNG|nr:hypothetical protein DFQ27_009418 [Actinomortierella ambigua]